MSRLLALLMLLVPAALVAQQDAAGVRGRFASLADSAELRTLEQRHAAARTSADDYAAGFAALRLWQVTGNRNHARRARDYFDRIVDRDPNAAWAHYGHALSLQAEMDDDHPRIVTHVSAQRALGMDPVSRARRALERALELDPRLPGARDLLAQYAAQTRDRDALRQVRTSYERDIATGNADTDVYVGLAVITRELNDARAAIAAAQHAVLRAPEDARVHYELAASLALERDSALAAGTAYYRAIDLADDSLLALLWRDVDIIARTGERIEWRHAATTDAKRDFMRKFWGTRGALAALTPQERAAEHYTRTHIARQSYRRQGMFGAPPLNALRWEPIDKRFDDRGVIYVRHGEPAQIISDGIYRLTWFYYDDDGSMLSYHFRQFENPGWQHDFVLLQNLDCNMSPDVARYDRRLTPLVRGNCGLSLPTISKSIRDDAERALVSDSHRPLFDTTLPFHYDWYSFRGDGGRTSVVMSVGLPTASIEQMRTWRLGLTIADTAHGSVARNTVEGGSLAARAAGNLLRTHVSLDVTPARAAAYRVDVRGTGEENAGMVYGGHMRIPSYVGDTLMMSDLVLADARDAGSFTRGSHTLALSPTQVFERGNFRVFYEIYNLQPGAGYRTEIVVQPAEAGVGRSVKRLFGRDDAVRLQFDDRAPDDATSTLGELRDVVVPFPPGLYEIRVTTTVIVGKKRDSVTRTREFRIE